MDGILQGSGLDHGDFDGSNIGSLPTIAGEFTHQATQIYDWI